ncbi:hypothetical protein SDC9_178501 [bioreactor metagenome]|uniref:Uncharacterized protein n=1 Tax=bioreactor metagenome TaxID=1076179 RepID=A0A645GXD4_9ZZZZ
MKDNLFNIDFRKLAVLWIMTDIRKNGMINFIHVLIFPLVTLYVEVMKNRKQNLIKMNHNYQKFSMQKRLNDAFDRIERRIKIVRAVQYEGIYLYTEAETDPTHPSYFSTDPNNKIKWLFGDENPTYLRSESELTSDFDFIVEIPNTNINQFMLKAEIDFYVLQTKSYLIVIK